MSPFANTWISVLYVLDVDQPDGRSLVVRASSECLVTAWGQKARSQEHRGNHCAPGKFVTASPLTCVYSATTKRHVFHK